MEPVTTPPPTVVEDPISDNPDDILGNNVYMSLSWMNISKGEALRIRDAAIAAANALSSFSVAFSSPLDD